MLQNAKADQVQVACNMGLKPQQQFRLIVNTSGTYNDPDHLRADVLLETCFASMFLAETINSRVCTYSSQEQPTPSKGVNFNLIKAFSKSNCRLDIRITIMHANIYEHKCVEYEVHLCKCAVFTHTI